MRRYFGLIILLSAAILSCKHSDTVTGPTTGPYAIYNFDSVKFTMYIPTLVRHGSNTLDSLGHRDSTARIDSNGSNINIPTLYFKALSANGDTAQTMNVISSVVEQESDNEDTTRIGLLVDTVHQTMSLFFREHAVLTAALNNYRDEKEFDFNFEKAPYTRLNNLFTITMSGDTVMKYFTEFSFIDTNISHANNSKTVNTLTFTGYNAQAPKAPAVNIVFKKDL